MGPSESKSHITTRLMGTSGYAAPEYVSTGHLYDVYGFGVVLAEMMTALHAMDPTRPSGRENLVDWIKPYLYDRRKLKTIMDSCLEGTYSSRDALRIAQLALKCIAVKQKGRPAMEEVVETLELLQAGNENVTVIRKAPRRTAPTSQAMPRPRTD